MLHKCKLTLIIRSIVSQKTELKNENDYLNVDVVNSYNYLQNIINTGDSKYANKFN